MKKFFSIFAATALMLSFVACDKKDKSSDEPTTPSEPQSTAIALNATAVDNWVKYVDACEDQGWWQIQAQNDKYYVTLSNYELIDAAPGIYKASDLDPDYSFIYDLDSDEEIAFTSGKITLTVAADGKVTVAGTLTGDDKKDYAINLVYSKEYKAVDMTFKFEAYGDNEGIAIIPSLYKPWDYYVVSAETYNNYGGNTIAAAYFSNWESKYGNGAYWSIIGSSVLTWDEIYSYCTDEEDNVVPGNYVLVVWGAIPGGVTTDAAACGITITSDEAAKAPAKLGAKKAAKKVCKTINRK
jgi:hypothetical protein